MHGEHTVVSEGTVDTDLYPARSAFGTDPFGTLGSSRALPLIEVSAQFAVYSAGKRSTAHGY
jgi:hypothetical protein